MCTCTEDKEVIGTTIIGRNRVVCQECKDNQIKQARLARIREVLSELSQLDIKFGNRTVREDLISRGVLGFNSCILIAENQSIILRAEKVTLESQGI